MEQNRKPKDKPMHLWSLDAFELWCWRRLLRVPWTARRSNQSILMEISPGCSLEGLMLKLKRQYFGHLMWRADSLEKTLMLEKFEGRRRRGRQRMRLLDGIIDSMDMGLGGLRAFLMDRKAWHDLVHGVAKSSIRLSNWIELNCPGSWGGEGKEHQWKFVAESHKDAGVFGLLRRRIQSGARDKAGSLRAFLCNKVLLNYKGDRESFWHRHQKGVERVPPC